MYKQKLIQAKNVDIQYPSIHVQYIYNLVDKIVDSDWLRDI